MIELSEITQTVVNWSVGAAGAVATILVKSIYGNMGDLQKRDDELAAQIAKVELLVAGKYVDKDSFDKSMNKVFDKLDKIDDKIDRKVDKQ